MNKPHARKRRIVDKKVEVVKKDINNIDKNKNNTIVNFLFRRVKK